MLDRFIKLYARMAAAARARNILRHNFANGSMQEYRGGWCDARFEKVERLFDVPRLGQPLQYRRRRSQYQHDRLAVSAAQDRGHIMSRSRCSMKIK